MLLPVVYAAVAAATAAVPPPVLGRYVSERHTVKGAPVYWVAGGRRFPVDCSVEDRGGPRMCGHWKLDPCVDWTPVNHSYIDSLIESGPFNCGLDWPPWEPHLTPAIMNSPPGMAHGFPSFVMWHDIAAALTVRNATSQRNNMTHHVWIGSYPYGGFQGYPFLDTSGFAIGNAWQRASSQDLVHWENHGNSVGRLTGFTIQDPASGHICAAQRGGCEFWAPPAGCTANGSNNARNRAEDTPIQVRWGGGEGMNGEGG